MRAQASGSGTPLAWRGAGMAKLSFEAAMKRLETIVEELEKGDLPLEKALKRYEEGVRLAKQCQEHLDKAELKLKQLSVDRQGKISINDMAEENG